MKNQSTVEVPVTDQSNATPDWYDYTNASYTIEEWLPQLVSANQLGIQALYYPQGWVNHVSVLSRFAWAKTKPIRSPLISPIQWNGSLAEISSKKAGGSSSMSKCLGVWVVEHSRFRSYSTRVDCDEEMLPATSGYLLLRSIGALLFDIVRISSSRSFV